MYRDFSYDEYSKTLKGPRIQWTHRALKYDPMFWPAVVAITIVAAFYRFWF